MSRSRRLVEMMRGFTHPDMFGLPDDMQQMPLSDFQAQWGDAMEVVVITSRGEDVVHPTAVKVGDTVQLPEIGNVKIIEANISVTRRSRHHAGSDPSPV